MLKVYPKRGCAVRDPMTTPVQGGLPRRVGLVIGSGDPTGEPAVFDESTAAGLQILRHLRKDELLPADEATARAAGVLFTNVAPGADKWAEPVVAKTVKGDK